MPANVEKLNGLGIIQVMPYKVSWLTNVNSYSDRVWSTVQPRPQQDRCGLDMGQGGLLQAGSRGGPARQEAHHGGESPGEEDDPRSSGGSALPGRH